GSCVRGCIRPGSVIDPRTGLVPVVIDLARCNACGLCFDACPEPYALCAEGGEPSDQRADVGRPEVGPATAERPGAEGVPDRRVPLPARQPLLLKGTYASAVGALLAGCRHVFGYPITPSTEGAELMAELLPELGGIFLQAPSEVATVNMMYGAGGAGRRCMTFTSSPGFSLMLEGISYLVGAEVPAVFVEVMRAGPGLGNIGPEQADLKLLCRGLGHGNTHAVVLAPSTPQEMLDLTMLAFDLAFTYRNPVVVAADGYLGQMAGKVRLPAHAVVPGLPAWAVSGDAAHRANLITSIELSEPELEAHNLHLQDKYLRIAAAEQRAELHCCEDAEVLLVACNTPARLARGAVAELRAAGVAVGLLRPVTVWPFPIEALQAALAGVRRLVVVEASSGQLEDELRLASSHAELDCPPITHVRRMGGVLPSQQEIVDHVRSLPLSSRESAPARAGAAARDRSEVQG
ncbi:MAG TPA: 3-methyl-2-oxobutanoate dehydrogenase subunit VorB, partial [Acidimicrobiales bacterium]|nr:3-methyl-2-oxobutanoate dehydrogenase subunit VorB [Acidimicrobiales bacterium]